MAKNTGIPPKGSIPVFTFFFALTHDKINTP